MLHWIKVVFVLLWVAAMWYAVIYAMCRGWGPLLRNKRQKKVRVDAKIKAKQGRHEFNPLTWQPEIIQKVLLFECADGIDRDYDVHDDVFDWVEVGDDGVLVYQGDLFCAFEARRPRHDLDKMYENLTRT